MEKMVERYDDIKNFFKDKTVLVTGHTGFKGSWLSIWLNLLEANVIGYALDPQNPNDLFNEANVAELLVDNRGDIRDSKRLHDTFEKYAPDIVFHLAAQPLVLDSYEAPKYTYETNLIGTINILEEIRLAKKNVIGIMVTTDKCYENNESGQPFVETDKLGGKDPYSSSKAAAEIAIKSWNESFLKSDNKYCKAVASVRAGNIIGGGDWSKNRLIPDIVRALQNNQTLTIRNPNSIRPWQFVLEPLYGYLKLSANLYENPDEFMGAWNFGSSENNITVTTIISNIANRFPSLKTEIVNNETFESKTLKLNSIKSYVLLNWETKYNFRETIGYTFDYYFTKDNKYENAISQIQYYIKTLEV